MSKLQRSSVSFRRQGSSGRIWDDPLRALDLRTLATPRAAPGAVEPLHPDAGIDILAGDPSPRVVSRSLMLHGGCGGGGVGFGAVGFAGAGAGASLSADHDGVIVESPDVAADPDPESPATVVVDADGERHERPARRRRKISSAFCACMGHPPASHAQQ